MCQTTNLSKEERRLCTVCDSKLHGRSDKVFCSIKCKNKDYSRRRREFFTMHHETITKLARNNYILSYFQGKDTEKYMVSKKELRRLGFHPEIVTGVEKNKYGDKYQVFDFSWYPVNNQCIMVYRNKDAKPISPYLYNRWLRHLSHAENKHFLE